MYICMYYQRKCVHIGLSLVVHGVSLESTSQILWCVVYSVLVKGESANGYFRTLVVGVTRTTIIVCCGSHTRWHNSLAVVFVSGQTM